MPHRFTDSKGRDWILEINFATVKAVRIATGVNLYEAADGSLFVKLASDPLILADLLFVVCAKQAADRGMDSDEFGAGLAGDPIEAATKALIDALVDFFPKGRREVLATVAAKLAEATKRAEANALAKIQSMTLETLSASPTSSPELPELTPARTHSEK